MDRPFWNPKNETLPREDLHRLQLAKLKGHCEWAAAKSPFHRRKFDEAGFEPAQLKSLDDLRRIPMMTRAEWMECQAQTPLFGDLITATRDEAIRYHLTSGTSGRQPLRVLDGTKDWEWIAEMWCYGFWGFGVRPTDAVFFAFSYGSFIGFWGAHYCCEKIGALVLPSGNMTTENRVRQIAEMDVTTVCATPTYALRMAQVAREAGIDLPGSKVNKLIVSGEPAGSIPAVKRMLEEQWGAKCGDTAGMTEIGTIMVFEGADQPGGVTIIEDNFIEEVVDPETLEPKPYGEEGERIVTSFGRGFIPLIRYRTGDLVKKVPFDVSSSGRTWDLYEGGILGRSDDMKLIRGTNVYPRAVEAIVREYPQIDEFQIVLWRKDNVQDEITVKIEIKAEHEAETYKVLHQMGDDLARNHEGLRFNVDAVDHGALPRFELKAKRLVDERRLG
jgi:phenylacetate-CoA ligase